MEEKKMIDFEIIWQRIRKFEGETFHTIRKLSFTYEINDDVLIPSRTDFKLTKENFRQAFNQIPVQGPSYFSEDIMGASYVWGILSDTRIVG